MPLITVIETLLNQPPIPFKPEQQSLKGWVMFCLRDRGFKVIYAQNADFAIETREGDKVYFNVTEDAVEPDSKAGWIVRDRDTHKVTVLPPHS
ncbi:hypothetical protein [Stenomitos frigidus]|uniref:Uncharacterized protein n=1 Tax=Stenomitos frigidus ULC18 TaxID=2107698 RepID=A0A2T1DTJ8_9CYAN|nr:hypothetical protein [Stenomitos frigidus]PSB23694.1 hypothetical protein C7B82_29625 [Stenomitos frigidus ULC18]